MAAVWFEESVPGPATVADLVPVERLTKSAQWALGADGTDALSRLTGTTQRAVYDGARDTTLTNVARTDMRWAREARADACAFCKLLASRSKNLYTSKDAAMRVVGRGKAIETNFDDEGKRKSGGQAQGVKTRGSRKIGEKYHDDCRCLPIEVPNPSAYEPPAYVEDWDRVYRKAWDAVPDGTSYDKNGVLKAVLSEWRQIDGSS